MEFLLALQELRNPALDAIFLLATRLGEEMVALVPMILCYWCIDKSLGLRIGFTYFAGGIANQFSKVIFRVERPFVRDPSIVPHEKALGTATGYSFPSGHTTSATSLAAALALNFRKKWWVWALAAIYVALVGFSRMYLGVHTPADVCVGILMSVAMAVVVDVAFRDCEKHPGHGRIYFALCAGAALAMVVYAGVMVMRGVVPESQAKNVFETGGAAAGLLLGVWLERRYVRFETAAPLRAQVIKFVVGVAVALLFKEGLKLVLGTSLMMQLVRYFITVLVIVAGYPWAFDRVLRRKKK